MGSKVKPVEMIDREIERTKHRVETLTEQLEIERRDLAQLEQAKVVLNGGGPTIRKAA